MMSERDGERGQVLVLFTLFIVVIMGFAAVVIDLGLVRNANQNLWNSLDAGALAGVAELPGNPAGAEAIAMQYAGANYPGGLPSGAAGVSFRCLVGDRNGDNLPDAGDIPAVCDPGAVSASAWRCAKGICVAPCDPDLGHVCNTLVMDGRVTVDYHFGPAVGVEDGSTQAVQSAACKGPCGAAPVVPVDVALIVDRTTSMNGVDTANARAAAESVRKLYNPAHQWLAFGLLGPSSTSGGCVTAPASSIGTANTPADVRRWVPIGLTGIGAPTNQDFTATGSAMQNAISCFTNSSTGTDLRDPFPMATYELLNNGRSGVTKGIILMSDGQPNASTVSTSNYCAQADAAATAAKNAGIEVFTVAFGLDGTNDIACPDTSGAWKGKKASQLLASQATSSLADNGCPGTENSDGDHYFCVPKTAGASTDLSQVFKTAATSLVGSSKLVHLP